MARHQIVLIGRRLSTALIGVKEFHPDVLHLIYTPILADRFDTLLGMIDPGVKVNKYLVEPYDAGKVYFTCAEIASGLTGEDALRYNLTEGTKIAALSALFAARDYGGETVYYSQEGEEIVIFTDEKNEPAVRRGPIRSRISNEEFIRLYGSNMVSYNDASQMPRMDVVTAWAIKNFHEVNQKTFQRLQHQFRSEFAARLDKMPAEFRVEREKGMSVFVKDGGMKITDRGKTIFEDWNPLTTRLFFTGRWWEVIVSDVVRSWDLARHANPSDSQVWRNVEFRGVSSNRTKNELDIMVNDRRRLVLIECKSGYIGQENIYKIDSTRETYGGTDSKGILVSYYPLDPELVAKCRDLHVYWFAPEKESQRSGHIRTLPEWLDRIISDIEE